MASSSYPDTTKVNPGDQVFVATPHPPSGEMSIQAMYQQAPYAPSMQTPFINPQAAYATQPSAISIQPSKPGAFTLNSGIVFRLGICTLVFGSINLICGICATALFGYSDLNYASSGIWGGVIIIASGVISIVSSRKPQNRVFNALNLALQCIVLCVCISVLVIASLNLSYFHHCSEYYRFRDRWSGLWKYYRNMKCPDKDEALATYSLIVICICAQIGISTAVVIFTSRAYPGCRTCTSNCLAECAKDCCCDSQPTSHKTIVNNPQSFQTGYGTMSPNVQQMPSGQILYMMTPVAVTTQHPQNASVNPTPQASLVMNS